VVRARSKSEGGAGQHFVPASLLPYGGFGDPDTPAPYWKPARTVDPQKVALSKAQDRFMRRVRTYMRDSGVTDEALEMQLGYRRYGLSRKLNGQELMTMRDLLRIAEVLPSALAALAPAGHETVRLAEPRPAFQKTVKSGVASFHESLQTAVEALDEAADYLHDGGSARNADLEPVLRSLGTVINDVGHAVAGRKKG
jgi:hypothetical protein